MAPHVQHEVERVVKLQKSPGQVSVDLREPGRLETVPAKSGKARARVNIYAGFAASRAHWEIHSRTKHWSAVNEQGKVLLDHRQLHGTGRLRKHPPTSNTPQALPNGPSFSGN